MSSQADARTVDEAIIEAAEALFADGGAAFTMDQLETKAGVSRATIYRRVGSKEALLKRLAEARGVDHEQLLDVRTRILKAARQVFGRHGLAGATMEQIAAEAGVGVITIYRHFGDKDSLVWAFVDKMAPRAAVHEVAAHPGNDIEHDLMSIADAVLPFLYEHRDILRLMLAGTVAEQAYIDHLRRGSDRTLYQLADYLKVQIEGGSLKAEGDPKELALTFVGMLFSFALLGPTHYGIALDEPKRISQLIVTIFLKGLGS